MSQQQCLTTEARERCIKISDLIRNRKNYSEVSEELAALFDSTIDINFQDQNRSRDTFLHSAVRNFDVKCVEFLLKFQPQLEIRNEDNQTPFDIICGSVNPRVNRFNRDEILTLLERARSSSNTIDQKYVHTIEFASMHVHQSWFQYIKVLRIIKCPNFHGLLRDLQTKNFATTFKEAFNFFFIDVYLNELFVGLTKKNIEALNSLIPEGRPFIVKITSQVGPGIYDTNLFYKEEKSTALHHINMNKSLPGPRPGLLALASKMQSSENCNFPLLLQVLQIKSYGEFHDNILEIKLPKNEDRHRLTNRFSKNSLCLRFLKLFEESLNDQQWEKRVFSVMNCKGISCLKAILDHPFNCEDLDRFLPALLRKQLKRVDSRNYNLLMMAVEKNNVEAVKYLLQCRFDLSHAGTENETAVDIAWKGQFFNCLLLLLEADSHFPSDFDVSLISSDKERESIEDLIKEKDEFFSAISNGDLNKVKETVKSKPQMKYCYSENNMSALTTALLAESFQVYAFLRSEGFSAEHDDYKDEWKNLQKSQKEKIRDENRKFFYNLDKPYLNTLVEKSRLNYNTKNKENCYEVIRKMYSALDEVNEVAAIMKLIANEDELIIVFDFNLDNVSDMDPTKLCDPSKPCSIPGTTYHEIGFIYIAVKNFDDHFERITGTLAHEMCHYAMFLTYHNKCLPFHQDDRVSFEAYRKVFDNVKLCYQREELLEELVSNAFINYEEDFVRAAELIVRVPHMLTQYKGQKERIDKLKDIFSDLFKFYELKVQVDIIRQCNLNDDNYQVRIINQKDSLLTSICNKKIKLTSCGMIEDSTRKEVTIMSTNSRLMTLTSIFQASNTTGSFTKFNHIMIHVETLRDEDMVKNVISSLESSAQPKLYVDCNNSKVFEAELIRFLKVSIRNQTVSSRIYLIVTDEESFRISKKILDDDIPNQIIQIRHSWLDLDDNLKNEKLRSKVNFQGHEVEISQIVDVSAKALTKLDLDKVLNNDFLTIGKALVKPPFYIPRTFIPNSDDENTEFREILTLKNLLDFGNSQKAVLISGPAGSGKSSSLLQFAIHLKDQFPASWVSFVELNEHIESFESFKQLHVIESFSDFFVKTVLAKDPVERDLFEEKFSRGEAFILMDGFDEISPNYKELLLESFSTFDKTSTNQLWITTRPHLVKELEETMQLTAFTLSPMTKSDQVNLVVEFWGFLKRFSELDPKEVEIIKKELMEKAENLIEKLSLVSSSGLTSIGLPMLIKMLAKLFADNTLDFERDLNLIFIYEQFIHEKITNYINKRGISINDQTWIVQQKNSVMDVHYRIALMYLMNRGSVRFDEIVFEYYDSNEWKKEIIERIGIVRFDAVSGNPLFDHETFAEFLLASFIYKNMKACDASLGFGLELFLKISLQDGCQTIKSFLNQMLKDINFSGNYQIVLRKTLNEKIKEFKAFGVLSCIVSERYHNLAEYILTFSDSEVLRIMLLQSYFTFPGKTMSLRLNLIYSAALISDVKMILLICNAAKDLTANERKLLFLGKGSKDYAALHFAAINHENDEMFETVWNQMKDFLTDAEKKDVLMFKKDEDSYLFQVFSRGNPKLLNSVLTILVSSLDPTEVKEILLQKDYTERSLIQIAFQQNSKESIEFLCNRLNMRNILSLIEVQALFLEKVYRNRSLFHFIAMNTENSGILTMFWGLLETSDICSAENRNLLVLHVDDGGESILHTMIRTNNLKAMTEFFDLIRNFDYDIMRKIFFNDYGYGSHSLNPLQLAVETSNEEVFSYLCEKLAALLTPEDEKLLFHSQSKMIPSIFHYSASNTENTNILISLHDYVLRRRIFTKEEVKKILMAAETESNDSENIFKHFALHGNGNSVEKLVGLVQTYMNEGELKKLLLDSDLNCLHYALLFSNHLVLNHFFVLVKRLIEDQKELEELFKKCDENGSNFFHAAASNTSTDEEEDIFPTFLSHLNGVLKVDDIKKSLLNKNKNHQNILHLLTFYRFEGERFKKIFTNLKTQFLANDGKNVKDLFFEADYIQMTPLHLVVKYKDALFLKIFFQLMRDSLELEDIKSLVKTCGKGGRNIFFYAVENDKFKFLESLRDCLKGILTDTEIKEMLLKPDSESRNILSQVTRANRAKDVVSFLREYLNLDGVKQLLDERKAANDIAGLSTDSLFSDCLKSLIDEDSIEIIDLTVNNIESSIAEITEPDD